MYLISDELLVLIDNDSRREPQEGFEVVDLLSPRKCGSLAPYPLKLEYSSGGIWRGKPLVCGGFGEVPFEFVTPKCYMHDHANDVWTHIASLQTPRAKHAVVKVPDGLWFTGGWDGSRASRSYATTEFVYEDGNRGFKQSYQYQYQLIFERLFECFSY